MRLYHSPQTRSTRVLWTLEEIGCPYDVTVLTVEQRRNSDKHRQLHPLGRVPVIELDDGRVIFESAAICLQLADLYPEAGLIAGLGSDVRALVYQWTVFAVAEVERAGFAWLNARRRGEDEKPHAEAFEPIHAALSANLSSQPWMAGDTFTVADIMLASMLRNPARIGLWTAGDPVRDYVERALRRPANLRADARDALEPGA